jgi:hypothetical protein
MRHVENEASLGKQEIDADLRTDIRAAVSSSILRAEAAVSSKSLVERHQTNGSK